MINKVFIPKIFKSLKTAYMSIRRRLKNDRRYLYKFEIFYQTEFL